jgi:hypothetical protein
MAMGLVGIVKASLEMAEYQQQENNDGNRN